MRQHFTLLACVVHLRGNSRKAPVLSDVRILLGPLVVATATLGGKYRRTQAIRKFQRFPQRFAKGDGYAAAQASSSSHERRATAGPKDERQIDTP